VPQQRLRRHDHQGLAEFPAHLTTQDVEIIGGGGAVDHLQIVFGAQLQEALKAGRGVLGALALIAVGQEHDQAAHPQPLAFARRNELVDHHLGAIGEVAELAFPEGQGLGIGQGEAVFKAQDRLFREGESMTSKWA